MNAPNVPVLMYHHVTPAGGMIAATPDVFEAQISRLARAGYQSLTTAQFAAYLAGASVPERAVLITFDDGYLNNWTYAHPILQRYGMKAILFLITGWAGQGEVRPHEGQGQPVPRSPDHYESKRLVAEGRTDEVMLRWSEVRAMLNAEPVRHATYTREYLGWGVFAAFFLGGLVLSFLMFRITRVAARGPRWALRIVSIPAMLAMW